MRDHFFDYYGEDLIVPLSDLADWIKARIPVLSEAVSNEKSIVENNKQNIRNMNTVTAMASGMPRIPTSSAELELAEMRASFRKAKNWLRECERLRGAKFTLDFGDLDWLYRPKREL